jgi:hypothetical protein
METANECKHQIVLRPTPTGIGICQDCGHAVPPKPQNTCQHKRTEWTADFSSGKCKDCWAVLPIVPSTDTASLAATTILFQAAHLLQERGEEYDKEGGERSMESTVKAFNAITGKSLTITEGWQFMMLLKMVRLATKAGHTDSALDLVAYSGLCAEEALKPIIPQP